MKVQAANGRVGGDSTPCPVCSGTASTVFHALSGAPVTCASVFPDAATAKAVPSGEVELACCHACGFIYNRAFNPQLAEIGARYESSQASSPHFGSFARALAQEWVDRYALRGKRVLEIGCGHGEFLAELARAGAGEGVGFDPLGDPGRLARDAVGRVQLRVEPFDEHHVHLDADALVCRHMLEHIHDTSRFLGVLRSWAAHHPASPLLFEVPAMERVLTECAFWDVYYEHATYFTQSTLDYAFRLAGFDVLRTRFAYDGQYLLIEAIAAARTELPRVPPADAWTALAACQEFGRRARLAIDGYRSALGALAAEARPIVLWQGAAKTVGFLSALADDRLVDCAIDVNTGRQGCFLPLSALPVCAPQALQQLRPKQVILMNPVYRREVTEMVAAMGLPTKVLTVNDLYSGGAR